MHKSPPNDILLLRSSAYFKECLSALQVGYSLLSDKPCMDKGYVYGCSEIGLQALQHANRTAIETQLVGSA